MFLNPTDFGIVRCLEANWETIREEYLSLPEEAFDPWVQRSMHGAGWSVYGLIAGGHQIPSGVNQCPRTSEILGLLDGIGLAGFSRMAPGTHILPHSGWAENFTLAWWYPAVVAFESLMRHAHGVRENAWFSMTPLNTRLGTIHQKSAPT